MSSKSKMRRHRRSGNYFSVVVRLLEEDSCEEIDVPEDATGKWLFEEVCRHQDVLEEKEYFGLRYLEHEVLSPPTKQWINLSRSVSAQLKNTHPKLTSFRFKHYPSDPLTDLRLPKTFYLLYRQLRRDLLSGRLVAADDVILRLAALVLQVELGDSSMQDLPQISIKTDDTILYLTEFKVLRNQTPNIETQLLEEHKKLEGLLPSEAAMEMIEVASKLETYGIDPVRVKTKAFGSRPIHLGLTHRGVAEFVSNRCQKLFMWPDISWMTCDGRYFVVSVSKQVTLRKRKVTETIRFKCETKAVARALWEWASDRQLFMTLEKSSGAQLVKSKRGLFSRSLTFKFAGRCRREVLGLQHQSSTLPSDLGACLMEPSDSFSSGQVVCSNSQCISMVALAANEILSSEHELRAIHELDACERAGSRTSMGPDVTAETLGSGLINHAHYSSGVHSHVSTMRTTLSEPTDRGLAVFDSGLSVPNDRHEAANEVAIPAPRVVDSDRLVVYFDTLPRRRYAPESQERRMKLAHPLPLVNRVSEAFDTEKDDISAAAAIAELCAATEAVRAWATNTGSESQYIGNKSSTANSLRCFKNTPSPMEQSTPVRNKSNIINGEDQSSSCLSVGSVEFSQADSHGDEPVSTSGWRILTFSLGFLASVSLIGITLLLETEVHSPITTAIREHPWILDFDARIYRPFRATVFGLFRRP